MGFSLGSLFDPAGVFSGDKGDIFGNLIDPMGGALEQVGLGEYNPWADHRGDVSEWADDLGDANSIMAQNRWKNVREGGLKRYFQTGDPFGAGTPTGTKLTNKLYGTDYKPLWTTLGDTTPEDQQAVVDRGQDLSNYQGVRTVGEGVGKGFLNAFTFGLGSTAANALDNYGYDQSNDDLLKNAAKNYALNYLGQEAMNYGGDAIGNTGGYYEQGGGYVGNNDYGGTGGFNLGKTVGAGDYAPAVNAAAKGALTGAAATAASGGNSSEIGKGAITSAAMAGANKGVPVAMDYLGSLFQDDTIKPYGSSPAQIDMSGPAAQSLNEYTAPQAPAERSYGASTVSNPYTIPTEQSMGVQSQQGGPVSDFLSAMGISGGAQGAPGQGGGYGDLAAGLYGLYNANKQKKALKQQQSQLQDLFSPNSPYAQQMRQRLERRDAAGGRRSQYGPREAQLAAMLAERQANTMPQQNAYANQIGQYNNMQANVGLGLANNLYKQAPKIGQDIDGLLRMFQGGQ